MRTFEIMGDLPSYCDGLDFTKDAEKINDEYHIYVRGVLYKDELAMAGLKSRYTTYEDIIDEIDEAESDNNISSIIFHFDSCGGQAQGNYEVCRRIIRCEKPTLAYIAGDCGSAAYKMAVSTDIVLATPSSSIGSIGAIITIDDNHLAANAQGVKRHIFHNKEAVFKPLGANFGEITAEQAQYLQAKADKLGKQFIDFVKEQRPMIQEKAFNGSMFDAEEALSLGLIDQIF